MWEADRKDDPKDRTRNAPTHPGPQLPGQMESAITGEFGVVMMLGGGIPGQTQVLSIEIYRLVESLEWGKAHELAGGLLAFGFVGTLTLLLLEKRATKNA